MSKRTWVMVPNPPTKKMLDAMSNATYLTDGSDTEMRRRFNGMLEALPPVPKPKRVVKKRGGQP